MKRQICLIFQSLDPSKPHSTSPSMATHRLLRPPANPSLLSSSGRRLVQHRQVRLFRQGRRRPQVRVFAAMGDQGSGGGRPEGDSAGAGSIDEDMPTLWKRIGELEEEEQQQQQRCEVPGKVDALPPVELSRLQREDAYVLYRSGMLEVMGLLHLHPAAAAPERVRVNIGVTVTAKLMLPTSVLVVMLHLMDAATVILHGVQQKQ